MGTAIAITYLPPGAAKHAQLDKYQHIDSCQTMPVHVRFGHAGEIESNGLDFHAYNSMHTGEHTLGSNRRYETPEWAIDNKKLRALLVRYLEVRAGIRKPGAGTDEERMVRAQAVLSGPLRATRVAAIDKMAREYVELKQLPHSPENARRMAKLQQLIENVDTDIITNENIAKVALGTVHYYYRVGYNSVETAQMLHLKPPHIRQIVWRLRRTWNDMQGIQRPQSMKQDNVPREEIEWMIREGFSNYEISKRLRCHHGTVERVRARLGIAYSPKKEQRVLAAEKREAALAELPVAAA